MSSRRLGSLVLSAALIWPLGAVAAPGDADGTFSGNGRVKTSVANTFDQSSAVARQSNGKIILGGWGAFGPKGHDFVLVRYTKRGKVDNTFGGGDGLARLHINSGDTEEWEALHVLPSGKILALGRTDASFEDVDLVLARYKPDGRLDRSFSGDGKVVRSFGSGFHEFNDLVVFPNRDIGVVGKKDTATGWDLLAARFTSDGDFLGARVDDLGGQDFFTAATLQNGKLVAAGTSAGDFVIYRYTHDGLPDSAFGDSGGYSLVDFGVFDNGRDVVRLPNGKFVMVGVTAVTGGDIALARFAADGLVDTAWADSGKFVQPMGTAELTLSSIVLQPRDRFAIMGSFSDTGDEDFLAVRYHNNAFMDTAWGDFGLKTLDFGSAIDRPYDGLVQPDGRLVMAGSAGGCCNYHFAAARLEGDVYTELKVNTGGRVVAKGHQFPALSGREMVVTLLRKSGGEYREIDTNRPSLEGRVDLNNDLFKESRFRTTFDRPVTGQCRVRARWPGGGGYPASQDTVDFVC